MGVALAAAVVNSTTLPAWFCATLPQSTTDDLELRICRDSDSDNEDIIISLIEIHARFLITECGCLKLIYLRYASV